MARASYLTVGEYFDLCDTNTRNILEQLHSFIKSRVPDETIEKISWSMPTFYLNGNLVHYFAYKNHIGFYPGESGISNFTDEFKKLNLKYSKGAVQFPIDKTLPYDLIAKIVDFRVDENKSIK